MNDVLKSFKYKFGIRPDFIVFELFDKFNVFLSTYN